MVSHSRHADIWAIYQKYGGALSLTRLTHYCLAEGIWTEEQRQQIVFKACRLECRQVLKKHDSTGLPIAGLTEKYHSGDEEPLWVQRELWDLDDAQFNLGLRIKSLGHDWEAMERLHAYIEDRYHTSLPIPTCVMPPEDQQWWRNLSDDDADDALDLARNGL